MNRDTLEQIDDIRYQLRQLTNLSEGSLGGSSGFVTDSCKKAMIKAFKEKVKGLSNDLLFHLIYELIENDKYPYLSSVEYLNPLIYTVINKEKSKLQRKLNKLIN